MILSKERLDAICKKNNIELFNGYISFDVFKQAIEFVDLDEFIALSNLQVDGIIYFYYVYFDSDEFLIAESDTTKYPKELQSKINSKINEYNQFINSIDFKSSPSDLFLYFVYQGFVHYYRSSDDSYNDLLTGEKKLQFIINETTDKLDKNQVQHLRDEMKKEKDEKTSEIRDFILHDQKFYLATNQVKRREYLNQLLRIQPYFEEILINAGYRHPILFIEDLWREYKNSKKQ